MDLRPDDRVLVLGLTDRSRLRDWAAALTAGALIGIGDDDAVRAARRECADLENVMFAQGSRSDIPWAPLYFSVIIDFAGDPPTPEMLRVVHPEGRIVTP